MRAKISYFYAFYHVNHRYLSFTYENKDLRNIYPCFAYEDKYFSHRYLCNMHDNKDLSNIHPCFTFQLSRIPTQKRQKINQLRGLKSAEESLA